MNEPIPEIQKMLRHVCSRCGYMWTPRLFRPLSCPSCHSVYWDRKRTRITAKLHAELEKMKDEKEMQELLKKYDIWDAEFLTKAKIEKRRAEHSRTVKYRQKKYAERKTKASK